MTVPLLIQLVLVVQIIQVPRFVGWYKTKLCVLSLCSLFMFFVFHRLFFLIEQVYFLYLCQYGADFTSGQVATEACCICGGGSTGGNCTDNPDYLHPSMNMTCEDLFGDLTGSNAQNVCDNSNSADANGLTASEACCICGGGLSETPTDIEPGTYSHTLHHQHVISSRLYKLYYDNWSGTTLLLKSII